MSADTLSDVLLMSRALQLATLGRGHVSPNPLVGCVIVHEGRIIGEGWHRRYGHWHAEVNAVHDVLSKGLGDLLPQSTVYVTLEPCAHFGKTPPCADLLVEYRVKKVIICNHDPNPLVAGKGIQKLKNAGIAVECGVLEVEGLRLNQRFFTYIAQHRPYIILKWAETADGFIGNAHKRPVAISCAASRVLSHQWRSEEDAILVGTNTAQNDNPQLNTRLWAGRNPTRIVLDRTLRLSDNLHLFDDSQPTLCYNAFKNDIKGQTTFVPIDFDDMFLENLMADLHRRKIQSLIVEGGSELLQSFLNKGLFDEIRIFKSPLILGKGTSAPLLPVGIALHNTQKTGVDWLMYYKKS
ncbi:MAG: bifunctional diaminohydroxyphosphoribosylaminopyrimidine deaminase/5-amino-6-(5-phosphoribosylamino)uracil reductase RibD [Runella sp.]